MKNLETDEQDETKALHIFIKGRVQGVGFRYWTKELADYLKVKGWVRNCTDGSVECYAEGSAGLLKEFVNALKSEHPYAHVESIISNPAIPKDFIGFQIVR